MGKKTKIALAIAAASAAAWAGSKAISKPQQREGKQALQFERPIILAHRGGALPIYNTLSRLFKALKT